MTAEQPPAAILWFRRDLRLDDNAALHAAIETGGAIVPVYIREPEGHNIGPLGGAQEWWLHHSLQALHKALRELGSDLVLRTGAAVDVLADLAHETGAQTVFINRAYERDEQDRKIAADLDAKELRLTAFHGKLLHPPGRIKTGSGGSFKVFTPFWNAMQKLGEPREPIAAPTRIPAPKHFPKSQSLNSWALLPSKPDWAAHFSDLWTPGEQGAKEKLEAFIGRHLHDYKRGRDLPAIDATSNLSAHLAHGEITPARLWHATHDLPRSAAENVGHFRREVAWRDFCYSLLSEKPQLDEENWDRKFDAMEWLYDAEEFTAWTRGQTGYPIVDAGMRQLWKYGFMHNRVRMITASFLIKDLMIDWRKGEKWFRDALVDADPANNAGNWQWVAGSGADASPFFRVFNPVLQGEKFDPDGTYVREHVPELAKLDKKYIHKPFDAPPQTLAKAGIELGTTYPKPMIDHGFARDRALAAYKRLRGAAAEG